MSLKKTSGRSKKSEGNGKSKKNHIKASKGDDSDNRTFQRVPIQLLVDYKSEGNYLFDFCKDLGAGGVFIQTKSPLPQGSSVDLTFTIPDSKETLEATGKVIWVQPFVSGRNDLVPGMGVQFAGFGGDQRKTLEEFVSRYHGTRHLAPGDKDGKRSA